MNIEPNDEFDPDAVEEHEVVLKNNKVFVPRMTRTA